MLPQHCRVVAFHVTVGLSTTREPLNIPDENVAPEVHYPPDVQTQTEGAEPCSPRSTQKEVADKPHWITYCLGLLSLLNAIVAVWIAILSLGTSQRSMKVGQRAYLTYQVAVTNGNEIVEALRTDKDFFLTYQVMVTNMGNTPADSIYPKINVVMDPDRTPVMVNFPTPAAFELGPKESRVLTGQALFKHVHNVRGLPGLTTGFTGRLNTRTFLKIRK